MRRRVPQARYQNIIDTTDTWHAAVRLLSVPAARTGMLRMPLGSHIGLPLRFGGTLRRAYNMACCGNIVKRAYGTHRHAAHAFGQPHWAAPTVRWYAETSLQHGMLR